MRIGIVTPAPPGSYYGNRVTAVRWARILGKLDHRVSIHQTYDGQTLDLLIALHARRSAASVTRFRRKNPGAPIVIALTGTDLYSDIRTSRQARESLEMADRIIVLQPMALKELRGTHKKRARVIYQSVDEAGLKADGKRKLNRDFDVCVIGHLRPVKDPFRAALASRLLPSASGVRVLQVGRAMSRAMTQRARSEMKINCRYRWLGELPPARTSRILANSRICIVSSRIEGGANILSEAIVASVPVLASRVAGNVGILGDDYPGLFRFGDTQQLAQLITRAETNPEFPAELRARLKKLAALFGPLREQKAWARLLKEIG